MTYKCPTPPHLQILKIQLPGDLWFSLAPTWEEIDLEPSIYDFENFKDITISSHLYVTIEQADHYYVALKKKPKDEDLQFKMVANKLIVKDTADRD